MATHLGGLIRLIYDINRTDTNTECPRCCYKQWGHSAVVVGVQRRYGASGTSTLTTSLAEDGRENDALSEINLPPLRS